MLHALLSIAAVLLCLRTLPLVLELLLLSLAAFGKSRPRLAVATGHRLAAVIPAHNEERLVAACVRSLLAATPPPDTVLVVAHNCTDSTAAQAEQAGATVLVLNDDGKRGKGAALLHGFQTALEAGHESALVIDADSVIDPLLIRSVSGAMAAGADAVQTRYVVANGNDDDRTRLMALSFLGMNVLRPLGRSRLGLSCGIFGNGFALSAATLRAIPYTAHSVVEDLEYHLLLVRAGRRVLFLDDVAVHGEMPDNKAAASTQRVRWEGGRARMRRDFSLRLAKAVLGGRPRLLEPLLDLISPPLATGAALLALTLLFPLPWARVYATVGLLAVVLYVLVAASLAPQPGATLRSVASVPKYLMFKLFLRGATRKAARSGSEWVRTGRNEREQP